MAEEVFQQPRKESGMECLKKSLEHIHSTLELVSPVFHAALSAELLLFVILT